MVGNNDIETHFDYSNAGFCYNFDISGNISDMSDISTRLAFGGDRSRILNDEDFDKISNDSDIDDRGRS